VFAGIFVGCLALAIAEMLNTIPVFARRVGFRHGLGVAILGVAFGKLVGSLIYFTQQVYLYGGS
jgi:stage V sporulation protein AB